MKLDTQKVVKEAIALMNEEGLKNVTLRKLAARLSIKAPSLFWHIKNKDELFQKMSGSLFLSCIDAMPVCSCWQDWMRAFGLAIWRVQGQTRDISTLISQVNFSPETRQKIHSKVLQDLSAFDLDSDIGMEMQASVQALVTGWSVLRQPSHPAFENLSPLEENLKNSLDVLIEGWSAREMKRVQERG